MNPIDLSLFVNRLQAVCDEMGATLRRTAFSPNIKDRLDFSCAIFSADGELCAQAAHIPVHLGSMAYAMREVVSAVAWKPGDMVIVNDPYMGGTHLPDVTLVQPVYADGQIAAFCANRAHHADIGCARPGSMPLSRTLAEEGLVIPPRHYLRAGEPDPDMRALLEQGLRNPHETLGDFAAQVSANHVGTQRLGDLLRTLGTEAFSHALAAVNDYAENLARHCLGTLADGIYRATDVMDGDGFGAQDVGLCVTITIDGNEACVDFDGTADMVNGNINCPQSVTAAAVYYAFYALMPPETPPCSGSMRALTLRVPDACLLAARSPAAVAAGNVETSQRVVDLLLAALSVAAPERIPAASQGTMNNIALGGDGWDYYETIGGGTGGHAGGRGLDATQSHMTNTLNTPVEVLEMNYPLRIERYAIRGGSGGAGSHRGGHGVARHYRFLARTEVTILSERRRHAPPGLAGGGGGRTGSNRLNGVALDGKNEFTASVGDELVIETPGGGGWGQV